jgi:hypothetical protein
LNASAEDIYPAAPKPKIDYLELVIGSLRHPQESS